MLVVSCAQYKRLQTRDNTERNRITNAILDYIYTEKALFDTYSCFSILSSSDTNEVIIEGSLNKFDILISDNDNQIWASFLHIDYIIGPLNHFLVRNYPLYSS